MYSINNSPNLVDIFKSLANDTRLSIVRKLVAENSEVASSEIVNDCSHHLQLSQPTMSHHFAQLIQSGVLIERKSGNQKYYSLNTELLAKIGIDPSKF